VVFVIYFCNTNTYERNLRKTELTGFNFFQNTYTHTHTEREREREHVKQTSETYKTNLIMYVYLYQSLVVMATLFKLVILFLFYLTF